MAVSRVIKCGSTDCVYNVDNACRAGAITVSNQRCPACDTFADFLGSYRIQDSGQISEIGACRVSSCIYNLCMNCQAGEIMVDSRENKPQCVTYQPSCITGILAYGSVTRTVVTEAENFLPEIFIG